jgi:hypothetical protein
MRNNVIIVKDGAEKNVIVFDIFHRVLVAHALYKIHNITSDTLHMFSFLARRISHNFFIPFPYTPLHIVKL